MGFHIRPAAGALEPEHPAQGFAATGLVDRHDIVVDHRQHVVRRDAWIGIDAPGCGPLRRTLAVRLDGSVDLVIDGPQADPLRRTAPSGGGRPGAQPRIESCLPA